MRSLPAFACATFCAALVLCGCDRAARAPLDPAAGAPQLQGAAARASATEPSAAESGFYPLAIGNRWHYTRDLLMRIVDGASPPPAVEIHASVGRELTGTETLFGREYVIEESRTVDNVQEPFTQWVRYRQDRRA